MNKQIFFVSLMLILSSFYAHAQAPNQINYQGVAHQLNGNAIANQNISVRLSIHHATANGAIQYSETRNVNTDVEGLFNLQIGSAGANITSGSWSAITWENGAKYLQVEMDAAGGSNFLDMGTQQLVSVPYAQYANKASALIPSATIQLSQIASAGATTNQVLKYNGISWLPGNDANNILLPYSTTDANAVSFNIVNAAIGGTALSGKASYNDMNSVGVMGEATSTNLTGAGVIGKASNTNAVGIQGKNTTGTAIKGSASPTNSSVPAILGECLGTSGIGVKGYSLGLNGIGVSGISDGGIGIEGNSNNIGVFANSLYGTALYAYSFIGTALDVFGKVKIAGGNTNPSNGAVLTSDSLGNATWKNNRVAFGAKGVNSNFEIPSNTHKKIEFNFEDYDLKDNFSHNTGTTSNSNTSVFTVPITGIYNLNATIHLDLWVAASNITNAKIEIRTLQGGILKTILEARGYINQDGSFDDAIYQINSEAKLLAGDKVWIEIFQINSTNGVAYIDNTADNWFRGTLLIAD